MVPLSKSHQLTFRKGFDTEEALNSLIRHEVGLAAACEGAILRRISKCIREVVSYIWALSLWAEWNKHLKWRKWNRTYIFSQPPACPPFHQLGKLGVRTLCLLCSYLAFPLSLATAQESSVLWDTAPCCLHFTAFSITSLDVCLPYPSQITSSWLYR